MRVVRLLLVCLAGAIAVPGQEAAPAPIPAAPVIEKFYVEPLAPPDMTTPYASPRDAARHRFQSAMAELGVRRDSKQGLREMAEALAADPTCAPAAFNLGLLCAVAGKWQDAIAALTEAARLEPARFGSLVIPQLERLRHIATLESTPEGQRTRRYDEALFALLKVQSRMSQPDMAAALVQIGRIDPKRPEAPGLLAGLLGDGQNYQAALKFLEIASANASDAGEKAALEKAIGAAKREVEYGRARAEADLASDKAEFDKAAQLYETAWKVIPARADSGMLAASAALLTDNTAAAAATLQRLRYSPDSALAGAAAAMLKELAAIEPTAKAEDASGREFFRDAGPADPVRIASLVPVIDRARMELLARPLPRMILDPGAVVLLEALAADRAPDALPPALPALPQPRVAGERPWAEIQQLIQAAKAAPSAPPTQEGERQSAQVGSGKIKRAVTVDTNPSGAVITLNDAPEQVCISPCDLKMTPGIYLFKAALQGHEPALTELRVSNAPAALALTLEAVRGQLLLQGSDAVVWQLNGYEVSVRAPAEIAVVPGLYRVTAKAGDQKFEQAVYVRPRARLRLEFNK